MASLAELKRMIAEFEEESGSMSEIVQEMKTKGGHLTDFGDAFVMLCKKFGIKQSKVARAIAVTPSAVNTRYNRKK